MINGILAIFGKQAKAHRSLQSFSYNRHYELGSGKDKYPLFWLESPIYGRNENNIFVNSVNFSILFIPNKDKSVDALQNLAFSAGLNIIERIKQDADSLIQICPNWTYTTLQNYYDDNACGCRFSVNFTQLNMQNLCLIEEQFDANKLAVSGSNTALPSFEIYENKLPNFNLKTNKKP